jgi:hypothetical protein
MGTKTWDGGATGNWNVSSNWSPAGVPVTGDDVVINTAGCTVTLDEHIGGGQTNTGLGSLTITTGKLYTNDGSNRMLTVTGATSIASGGTLDCTGSDIYLGVALYASTPSLDVDGTGIFIGGTGATHNIGNIQMKTNAVVTLTSGVTTLSTRNTNSYGMFYRNGGTFNHGSGKLVFNETTSSDNRILLRNATTFNEVEVNVGSGKSLSMYTFGDGGYLVTVADDLTITSGTFNTTNVEDATDSDLTVTGEVNVAGTLTCNSSVCSFGSLASTGLTNLADSSGSTLITNENSDGLSIVAGTFGTCVPAKIKHNNGTVTFNNHSDPAAHAAIVCGNSNATDGLYNVIIDGANTIVDTYDPGGAGQECKIHNNFTVTNGSFQVNGASNPFDVGGAVLVSAGKMFGDGAAPTGAMSFGSLTIASGAQFRATSGTTTINLNFRFEDGANFTHNSGTVTFAGATDANLEMEGGHSGRKTPTNPLKFHNLTSAKTGNYLNLYVDFTVESTFTITTDSTYGVSVRQPVYLTMGTATAQGTIAGPSSGTDNLYFATEATTSKILAANTDGLYPWIKTGNDWGWSAGNGGTINLENGDYQTTLNTETGYQGQSSPGDNTKTIKLTGDMKFAAVTVGSGDTLDLNGKRAEFSGAFDLNGSLDLDGSMAIFKHTLDLGGKSPSAGLESDADTIIIHDPPSTSEKAITSLYAQGTFFAKGVESEVTGYAWGGGLTQQPTNIFVGGKLDCQQNTSSTENITVATGGELLGTDRTLTVGGDFTTSGGLIGKSALDFDGTSECLVSDDSDFDSLTNATWMGWFKIDDVSADRNFIGQSSSFSCQVIENSTNKPRFSLYGGGSWTDLEGNTTITVDNKWHHIAYVMDGSNNKMYIYVDGKLDSEGAWTATLNGSGADIYLGGYRSGNVKGFAGILDAVSFWNVALTAPQIRAKMFSDFASLDSNTGCKGWWQFDEGTGGNGDTTASSVGSHPATLGPAGNAPNWVGAGTFTRGTSTVKLTGNGSASFAGTSTEFNNLEVASSSKTTTFVSVGGDDKRPVIRGTLTHGGGTLTTSTNCSITIGSGGTVSSGTNTSGLYFTRWDSVNPIPALTSKYLSLQQPCDFAGNQSAEQYIQFRHLHNIGDFNVTTARIISYVSSTVIMGAGTIEFTSTTGWGSNVYDNRVFTAGPGATIKGVGAKSGFASGNNWSVVGKIENLDVTNEELKVTGQVINCTGDIHQYFPTIDHSQQLDADTADDRDVRLGRDLDKNTELINS